MDRRSPSTSNRERQFVGEDLFVAFWVYFFFLCADLRSPLCAAHAARTLPMQMANLDFTWSENVQIVLCLLHRFGQEQHWFRDGKCCFKLLLVQCGSFPSSKTRETDPETGVLLTRWSDFIAFGRVPFKYKQKQPVIAQTEFIESSQACTLLHNLKMQHSLIVSLTSSY